MALKELLFSAEEILSEGFKFANEKKSNSREKHTFSSLGLSAFVMDGPAISIMPGSSCSISEVGTCS